MCNTFIEAHPNFLQNIFLCVTEGFSTFERLLRANRELGFELWKLPSKLGELNSKGNSLAGKSRHNS